MNIYSDVNLHLIRNILLLLLLLLYKFVRVDASFTLVLL